LEVNLIKRAGKTELHLIEATIGGDIESFGELARRYYAAMTAIAYSVLADHQLAEDAAQESFARALVNLKNLKSKSRFAPWLAAICRNVAKDMLIAKARRIPARRDDVSQVTQDYDINEDERLVKQAIGQLPADAKELIVLRYYNGLSYEKIGSVLGISKPTINGRLTRAKRKMKKFLKRNGFPENQL
jgi:RNA polymerase sigma-70 factor (ECF subfamily)